MDTEIKNTVYLALSCMLLAIVLAFAMFMIGVRGKMADARNDEVIGRQQIQEYQKYNAYNGKMTGLQVVRLITEHATEELEVYVKESNGSVYIYNRDDFLKNKHKYSIVGEADDVSDSPLVKLHANTQEKASKAVYEAFLVYDFNDVTSATPQNYAGFGNVTGVHVEYVGSWGDC